MQAVNLSNANLNGATVVGGFTFFDTGIIWNHTECPDGTLSDFDGGTCVGHGF
jgi:hypothetical protein